MEQAAYIVVAVALVAGVLLYLRRKRRKPVHYANGYVSLPAGSKSIDERTEFFCGDGRPPGHSARE